MRLLVPLLFMAAQAIAQEPVNQPPFPEGRNGPRLGIGLATQTAGGLFQNTTDMLIGPVVGWHFEAPLHWQVSLMPEILYMTKGSVVRNPTLGVRTRSTFRYLEVPLLVKISTDRQADGMYLLAGPSAGYFLSGRYQSWLNGQQNTDVQYDLSNNERRFQFSVVFGMGMEGNRWAFDVRAQSSVTPFDRLVRVQNQVYALTMAYRMGGKKPMKKAEDEEEIP
ncbi:MAG: PorT family protein [Flavobacteriales bacterium]|nr:PorT family protein [Flavobacteriales bacterium]